MTDIISKLLEKSFVYVALAVGATVIVYILIGILLFKFNKFKYGKGTAMAFIPVANTYLLGKLLFGKVGGWIVLLIQLAGIVCGVTVGINGGEEAIIPSDIGLIVSNGSAMALAVCVIAAVVLYFLLKKNMVQNGKNADLFGQNDVMNQINEIQNQSTQPQQNAFSNFNNQELNNFVTEGNAVEQPIPAVEPAPMVEQPIPAVEPAPVVEQTITSVEPTPVVEQPIPAVEPIPVVEQPIPAVEPIPVVEQPIPAVEPAPVVEQPISAVEPAPMVEQPIPAVEPAPMVEQPIPAVEPTPVVEQPIPAVEPAPIVEQPIPSVEPTPVVEQPIPSVEPTPVVEQTIPSVEPTPVVEPVMPEIFQQNVGNDNVNINM